MFTRRNMLWILGLLVLVAVAFFYLIRSFEWDSINDSAKEEPAAWIESNDFQEPTVYLTISVSLDSEQYLQFEQLSNQVKQFYPHINVEIMNYFDFHYSQSDWQDMLQLEQLGDIHLIPNDWIIPLAVQGYYQPVDRLLSSDVLAQQITSLTDAMKWNGYLWGVPYYANPYLIMTLSSVEELAEIENIEGKSESPVESPESTPANVASTDDSITIDATEAISNEELPEKVAEEAFNQTWEQIIATFQEQDDTKYLINVQSDTILPLWIWLQYMDTDRAQALQSSTYTENQLTILHWLNEHSDTLQVQSNDLFSYQSDNMEFPLYLIVSWEKFIADREILQEKYDLQSVESPLPWLNGLSFTINGDTDQQTAAIQWIEKMNALASIQASTHNQFPIRSSLNNLYSYPLTATTMAMFNEKLLDMNMMNVSTNWAEQLSNMNQIWRLAYSLNDKLDQMINWNN